MSHSTMDNRPVKLAPDQALIDGETWRRNQHSEDRNCPDCGVETGAYHKPRCDRERCPKCRHQLLSCDCEVYL